MYHFDLNYEVVRLRNEELVGRATGARVSADAPRRRRWFGRRRDTFTLAPPPPPEPPRLVVVPPPRHDRDPSGRDTRVA
jgi:hypothetical protein